MDGVGSEVDRAAGTDEVVEAHPSLRGEVPDAGVGVGAVVLDVVGRPAEGRILVVGPEDASGSLSPEGDAAGTDQVPAEDDRGDGDAVEGSAHGVGSGALRWGSGWVDAQGALELRGVGLPEREGLDGVLEVAAQGSSPHVRSKDLAGVDSGHEEAEVVAVLGEADAALNQGAQLVVVPAGEVLVEGVAVALQALSGGGSGGTRQKSEGPENDRSSAFELAGQWICSESLSVPRGSAYCRRVLLQKNGRRRTAAVELRDRVCGLGD